MNAVHIGIAAQRTGGVSCSQCASRSGASATAALAGDPAEPELGAATLTGSPPGVAGMFGIPSDAVPDAIGW